MRMKNTHRFSSSSSLSAHFCKNYWMLNVVLSFRCWNVYSLLHLISSCFIIIPFPLNRIFHPLHLVCLLLSSLSFSASSTSVVFLILLLPLYISDRHHDSFGSGLLSHCLSMFACVLSKYCISGNPRCPLFHTHSFLAISVTMWMSWCLPSNVDFGHSISHEGMKEDTRKRIVSIWCWCFQLFSFLVRDSRSLPKELSHQVMSCHEVTGWLRINVICSLPKMRVNITPK